MENKKEFRFICNNCGNCCLDKNTLVNVTFQDILRLKNGLNLTIDETLVILGFYIFEKKPTEEDLKKMVVPPIETERGLAFIGLFKKKNGECYFYNSKEKKCSIYNLRPNFCRTFPYSFKILFDSQKKEKKGIEIYLTDKGYQYCEGISGKNPLIDKSTWIELGKHTIKRIEDNNILIKKWNETVKSGKIEASARNFILTIENLDENKKK
ncbi:MAG: YkgJ family cysteine cluster protein [Promethearchaeota archaeon]